MGLATRTLPYLGWATFFLDVDNDGNLDLFAANGHIFPQVEPSLETYRQPDLLFQGNGEFGFQDVTDQVGLDQAPIRSSRGGAYCDYDNDGDLDLLVLAIDDAPTLLRNEGEKPEELASAPALGQARQPVCHRRPGEGRGRIHDPDRPASEAAGAFCPRTTCVCTSAWVTRQPPIGSRSAGPVEEARF